MTGRWQAKDIDDVFFLRAVDYAAHRATSVRFGSERDCPAWVMTWDMERMLPLFPPRVILAKAAALIKRGLLSGCACGCRGDFELTAAGKQLLTIATRIR